MLRSEAVNTRVRRNPERLPSIRCIESAQSSRARVRILPIRASDTPLIQSGNGYKRFVGTNPTDELITSGLPITGKLLHDVCAL